ncbi:MAG: diaminopimelate epimerase [Solirubrobacterales bacterium]|nr:diaminopimelate epimerase [Solirubrobacterales bacterium]
MRVEKWQALGNDYLLTEEPVTPAAARLLCDRHTGPGADGVLVLAPPDAAGFVARLHVFNPDGSEAELSGNGARQALMYLHRRGWTSARTFSIQTIAGEVRVTVLDERTCRTDLGRARLFSPDFPSGGPDGVGEVDGVAFQHVSIGNPQCAFEVPDAAALAALDLAAIGPAVQASPLFPNRTNVSWWTAVGPAAIRARIFERGVGETRSSGTGATGAAVAHVLRGGDSPVTVHLDGGELEVDVGENLHIDLTGWAVPVYAATLSEELVAVLRTAR